MSSEASGSASASNGSPEGEAMGRALDLALRGWGRVAPNPLVGAVVLRGDAPVGEGFHAEYGGRKWWRSRTPATGRAVRRWW